MKWNKFSLLFTFAYFISYITRINYGAIISEMAVETGMLKSTLSIALTGSFITYGTGQLISGFFGDRIQPKKFVSTGLITTVIMNLLIPVCTHPMQMIAVWCINGFAQAFMWPPIVKLMSSLFSEEEYKSASVKVSWGSSFGTIFVYLLSPVMIMFSSWKSVFIICAVCGVLGLFLWLKHCPDITMTSTVKSDKKQSAGILCPVMIFIMIAIILQGTLRDGVTTWMPSYISETFNLSTEISILTGVILPIFSIICHQAAGYLYKNKLKNPMVCAATIFATGALSALLLAVFTGKSAVLSVLLSAVLTGAMHGVNVIFTCMIPPFFAKRGNVSMISGLLNSCTYIGSAISAYLFPLISENASWESTIRLWLIIAITGTLIPALCSRAWNRFCENL